MELPFKLLDCNIYVDGADWLGKAEIELPNINHKSDDVEMLGIAGTLKIADIGNVEAMTTKIKFKVLNGEALKITLNPAIMPVLDVRGAIQETNSQSALVETKPIKILMKVQFVSNTLATWKKGDGGEPETEANVFYIKIEIDGTEILEYDPVAYIYKVDGEDILEDVRAALGK